RALIATTSMPRPQRAISLSRPRSNSWRTALPTVPSPARPTFSGAAMTRSPGLEWKETRLAPRRQRNDVVQHFRSGFKKAPDIAGRLTNALFVFHECDTDVAFAVFAEAGPGRYRHSSFLDQQRGKFNAAERAERFGYWRPGEHRGRRCRHLPARPAKRFHQRIAASPVCRAHLV